MSEYTSQRITPFLEGSDTTSINDNAQRVLPFRICRDGTWLYRDTPMKRKAMQCLFSSLLERDEKGQYWLKTSVESGIIQVDDVPFIAVELDFHGKSCRQQNLCLRTNMDELVCVGPEHPLSCDWDRPVTNSTVPYVHVRQGRGGYPLLARLSRAVVFELAALATIGHVGAQPCLGVWSQGVFFPLSRLPCEEGVPSLDWFF